MRYLHHKVHELDGYNQEFWKTLGYYLKCVLELVASTSHEKIPSKAPFDWALANVFEDIFYVVLLGWEQNITTRSEMNDIFI